MPESKALSAYQSLGREDQVRFLIRFGWELTIVARAYYEPGTENLTLPAAVRAVNELQHQVTQHALAVLEGNERRYPDDVLVTILTEEIPDHDGLLKWVRSAFSRAYDFIRSRPVSVVG
jgi:hypothetical protein